MALRRPLHGLLRASTITLFVSLTSVAWAQAVKLPQRVEDDLGNARLAAKEGDPGPALATIARLGSAGLTAAQRSQVALKLVGMGNDVLNESPAGALDIVRALRRALPDSPCTVEASFLEGGALRRLRDPVAALKAYRSLVGPAPPGTSPLVRRARAGVQHMALRNAGLVLLDLGRPAEGLQAFLDSFTARGVRHWRRGQQAVTLTDLASVIQVLNPKLPARCFGFAVLASALSLTPLQEERDTTGRVVACGLRTIDVIRSLARVWEQRQEPNLAKALRAAAKRYKAPPRPYRRSPPSQEDLLGFRVYRARVARAQAALPGLRQRANRSDPAALFALAQAFIEGSALPRDDARAAALIERALKLKHGPALLDRSRHARRDAGRLRVEALAAGERGVLEALCLAPLPLSAEARAAARRLAQEGEAAAWVVLARDAKRPAARHELWLRAARAGDRRSYPPLIAFHTRPAAVGVDPLAAQLWRRCLALTHPANAPKRFKAALTGAGAWRTRLPVASRRYRAAAIELAWAELQSAKPAGRALAAALRGLGTSRSDADARVAPAQVEWLPLLRVARLDRARATQTIAALTSRTDPAARHLLGNIIGEGWLGQERDVIRGFALHRLEARSEGRPLCGAAHLARGLPKLEALRVELAWAKAAAAKGDAWAAAYQGQILELGELDARDLDGARACYTRAAKGGSPAGHLGLVELEAFLETIQGTPRAEVDRHLRAAATLGHTPAWVRLARRLEARGDREGAAAAWAKGVAASNPAALLRAAGACFDRDDWKGGLKHVRRAAAAGSIAAYLRLLVVLHQNQELREPNDP